MPTLINGHEREMMGAKAAEELEANFSARLTGLTEIMNGYSSLRLLALDQNILSGTTSLQSMIETLGRLGYKEASAEMKSILINKLILSTAEVKERSLNRNTIQFIVDQIRTLSSIFSLWNSTT